MGSLDDPQAGNARYVRPCCGSGSESSCGRGRCVGPCCGSEAAASDQAAAPIPCFTGGEAGGRHPDGGDDPGDDDDESGDENSDENDDDGGDESQGEVVVLFAEAAAAWERIEDMFAADEMRDYQEMNRPSDHIFTCFKLLN